MTTITHTPDGPRFDGMTVGELSAALDSRSVRLRARGMGITPDMLATAAAALHHLSDLATPDPDRVTGRVRWERNVLFLGPLYCGFIRPVGDEWRSSTNCGGDGMSKIHPTEASARAALVAAVKDAIGDE